MFSIGTDIVKIDRIHKLAKDKKFLSKIFTTKENLRVLNSEFEKIKLEHHYLSSSEKLLEFQSQYFEDELIQKNIENIKVLKITDKDKKIENLKIIKE